MNAALWVNYFLILAISASLLLAFLLVRQRLKTIQMWLYLYLLLFFVLEAMATLYAVNTASAGSQLLALRIRSVAQVFFILIIVYLIEHSVRITSFPGAVNYQAGLFLFAGLIAVGTLLGLYFHVPHTGSPVEVTGWYFLLPLVQIMLLGQAARTLVRSYRLSRRRNDLQNLRQGLMIFLPLASLALLVNFFLPVFQFRPGILLLSYLLLAVLLFYLAIRFYLLEVDPVLEQSLGLLGLAAVGLGMGFLFRLVPPGATAALLSVPAVLGTVGLGLASYRAAEKLAHHLQQENPEKYEQMLSQFSSQLHRFIELETLWEYVATFLESAFQFRRFLVLYPQPASPPYRVGFRRGISEEEMATFLAPPVVSVLEQVELQGKMLNKFELPVSDPIFEWMDRLKIYLLLPVQQEGELQALLAIGGTRRFVRISPRKLSFLRMASQHLSLALENVEKIQQSMQAAKLADLGMFASQIAHDFRSFVTLVKLEQGENSQLRQQALYMEKLVQDLLNYARPPELKFVPCNVNHLIDMSLDLVHIPQDVVIEKHYEAHLPEILLDVHQMQRVFVNLLENALRAMEKNGGKRIKITTRRLRPISHLKRNPWIYIELLDEGEGIAEEYLQRIFDPFFTTHKREGGSGMGLAIVKQIIGRHGGFIDVTSKPGKGTVFNIRLPYRTGETS